MKLRRSTQKAAVLPAGVWSVDRNSGGEEIAMNQGGVKKALLERVELSEQKGKS